MKIELVFHSGENIEHFLSRFKGEVQKIAPQTAGSILASLAQRAFVEPELRPATWKRLSDAVLAAAGRKSKRYISKKKQANVWAQKARDIDAKITKNMPKKERKRLNAKRKSAEAKARQFRANSLMERDAFSSSNRKPLIDTQRLWHSISYIGGFVTSDAPYAAVHQWGSVNGVIPARPYVPIYRDGTATSKAAQAIEQAMAIRAKRIADELCAK